MHLCNLPRTRRAARLITIAVAGVACVAGCAGKADTPKATETVVVTQTATATPNEEGTTNTDTSDDEVGEPNGGVVGDRFVMPNEVGKVLQAAQDDLQARSSEPFFYSDSKDATSADRFQVLDSQWKVCSQNKEPGTKVAVDDQSIVFTVVRLDENCP